MIDLNPQFCLNFTLALHKLAIELAVAALIDIEANGDEYKDHIGYTMMLAGVYTGLGMKDEALAAGRRALAELPYEEDALRGVRLERDFAMYLVRLGEYDQAINLLEHVLSVPFHLESVNTLKISYRWDPIRDHPRFQKLIEKHSR